MEYNAIRDVLRNFATLSPGFIEWRQKTLRGLMKDFNMTPDEAVESMRQAWFKAIGRFDNDVICSVFEAMEQGRTDVPAYGEAPRAIAKHCQAIVNKRLADKRNSEYKRALERPEGDTSPDCTPDEVAKMRQQIGCIFRAKQLVATGEYDDYDEALEFAIKERPARMKRAAARRSGRLNSPVGLSDELKKSAKEFKKRKAKQ